MLLLQLFRHHLLPSSHLCLLGILFLSAWNGAFAVFAQNSDPINNGSCRIIVEKNEWAAGCIPAVNFVVKLVDCGDGVAMSDVTVRFVDENNKELGRDYFLAPLGQCTVTGYGNIKTITPRGGNSVLMMASCDLCNGGNGRNGNVNTGGSTGAAGNSLTSIPIPINGQVTDCF